MDVVLIDRYYGDIRRQSNIRAKLQNVIQVKFLYYNCNNSTLMGIFEKSDRK